MNLDNIGLSNIKDSTAFKKIQFFSKTNPSNIFNVKSDFQNSFYKLNSFYLNDLDLNNSYTYGMDRQHTFMSLATTLPNNPTLIDNKSTNKFFHYNFNSKLKQNDYSSLNTNRLSYEAVSAGVGNYEDMVVRLHKLIHSNFNISSSFDFITALKVPNVMSVLSAENDSKQYTNTFKFILNLKHKKKNINNINTLVEGVVGSEFFSKPLNTQTNFSKSLYNNESALKFKNYKSSNAQFLGSERTVRLLTNLNSNSYKWNTSSTSNLPSTVTSNLLDYGTSQNYIYKSSLSN